MKTPRTPPNLPVGRICARLRVGGAAVHATFVKPAAPRDASSAAAMRLAESLVVAAVGLPRESVRVAALPPSGAPVAAVHESVASPWISVSHVTSLIGAAASTEASVGLDIVAPGSAGRGLDVFFSAEERRLAVESSPWRAMLWAAKEAAYKAARMDVAFQPLEIRILGLSPHGFAWLMHGPVRQVAGHGRLASVAGHVVAVASATGMSPFTWGCAPCS